MDIAMQPNGNKPLLLVILVIVFLTFVLSAVQFFGFSKVSSTKKVAGGFFDSQNAMLIGTITAVKDDMITVQNKKGMKQDFRASKTLMIMGGNQPNNPAPGQADLSKIELNKEVSINLMSTEGELEISTIFPIIANVAPPSPPAAVVSPGKPSSATNSANPNPPSNAAAPVASPVAKP
jgi:hypothetical protein